MKIALLEDSQFDAKLSMKVLADAGYHSIDVYESISELGKSEHGYDVIFADLSLPQSWGKKTIQSLKSFFPETYLIVLTGMCGSYLTGRVSEELIALGAHEVISKEQFSKQLVTFLLKEHPLQKP